MKLHRIIFVVGIVIIINPFLGIPSDFRNIVNVVLGALLVTIAVVIKFRRMNQENLSKKVSNNQTFVETAPHSDVMKTITTQEEISQTRVTQDEQKV